MIGEKVEVETPSEQAVEGESSAAELEVDEAPDTQANGTDTSHGEWRLSYLAANFTS